MRVTPSLTLLQRRGRRREDTSRRTVYIATIVEQCHGDGGRRPQSMQCTEKTRMSIDSQGPPPPRVPVPSVSSTVSFHCIVSEDEESSNLEVFAVSSSSSHSSIPSVRRFLRPPETVVLRPPPSVVPYAQLCFDKEFKTLSTMLVGTKTMEDHETPPLTISDDDDDNDASSESGWSTGYSSDESLDARHRDFGHGSHGVVWISREWWMRQPHDVASHDDDDRALLPELRLASSGSSSEESTSSSMLSFKSCGKLFCHYLRKAENNRPYHYHQPHHHHHRAIKVHTERDSNKVTNRFYGYRLLNN